MAEVLIPEILALTVFVFLMAGAVKGIVGIGLPTITISMMSQYLDPRLAISLTLIPILLSNLWQSLRAGRMIDTWRRYIPFAASLAVVIYLTANFAQGLPSEALVLLLGSAVIIFSIASLSLTIPPLPDRFERAGQLTAGAAAGLMGGVTAIWGPPMVIFLLARRVSKEEFVRVTGALLAAGSIPLMASYWQAGHVTRDVAVLSTLLVVPAVIGFAAGERVRARLDSGRFRTAVLIMFLLLGLNLIRRGIAA